MIAEQLCFDYRMKNKRGGETMYTKPEVVKVVPAVRQPQLKNECGPCRGKGWG